VNIYNKSNTEKFIKKALLIGNNKEKYDYSLVDYVNNHTKVIIICSVTGHKPFHQRPKDHLKGQGCPLCGRLLAKIHQTDTLEEFIQKAKLIQTISFSYEKSVYINNRTKIIIGCPICHKDFQQNPETHLVSKGCPLCYGKYLSNTDEFIEKAIKIFADEYDYSEVVYVDSKTMVKIICKKHGSFDQIPNDHLSGHGCKWCGIDLTKKSLLSNTEDFIMKAKKKHLSECSYDKVKYVQAIQKVIIICNILGHEDFEQTPASHLSGRGCPICNASKGEENIRNILNQYHIAFLPQFRIKECRNKLSLPFDFAIIEDTNNLLGVIEYQGKQHFKPCNFGSKTLDKNEGFKNIQFRDKIKKDYCTNNKIPLLIIPYTEKDIENKILDFTKSLKPLLSI
jgi:hypothetical protein